MPRSRLVAVLVTLLALTTVLLPAPGNAAPGSAAPGGGGLERALATAYRAEVSRIDVDLTWAPRREQVTGRATLAMTLRPGQTRLLFHFNPLREAGPRAERAMLRSVRLDGERLDPAASADLRPVRTGRGAETAFEVRRDLAPGSSHTLVVGWRAPASQAPAGWLYPNFDDTEGPDDETETMWPTVSSPEVLARHVLRLRVRDERRFVVTGSGLVRRARAEDTPGARAWVLDTRRAVSSSTVFVAAAPRRDVTTRRLRTHDVEVHVVSDRPPSVVRRAVTRVRATIGRLERELGAFPVPRMSILLTGWGSGMEYYGATRTGLGALVHELGHMYFGVTAVNRTWRDTWFDESAVVWREDRGSLRPVPRDFRGRLGVGRSPVAPGFNEAAYGPGARVLARVARELGGGRAMLGFLRDLHARRAFAPFTTDDLIDDLVPALQAAGSDVDRALLEQWMLGG